MLRHLPGAVVQSWYHQPSAAERAFGVWVTAAGATQADGEFVVPTRTRPYWGLHVVMSGTVAIRAGASGWRHLGTGDAFAAFPDIEHELRNVPDGEPGRRLWIEFDGPAAAETMTHLEFTTETPWRSGITVEPFVSMTRSLGDVFDPDAPGLGATSYLVAFLAALQPIQVLGRTSEDWLEQGRTLMDVYYGDGITVDAVARQLRVDRTHFTVRFAAHYGTGPGTYLRDRRLAKARQMLRGSERTVTDIARAVGYADLYSFSHSYRSRYGIPPSTDRGIEP